MTIKNVIIVLHGGLGNQLFQFFRGLLILLEHPRYKIFFQEYFLDKYPVSREYSLSPITKALYFCHRIKKVNFFIRMRFLVKIINKILRKDLIISIWPCYIIVDGYFQNALNYKDINKDAIKGAIDLLRKITQEKLLINKPIKKEIHHIRLTDFFVSEEKSRKFIQDFLNCCNGNINVITDDEDLFFDIVKNTKLSFRVNVIPTKNSSSWDLLHILSSYRVVNTNGSSLAFWGALLSGGVLITSNKEHQELFTFINET